tara:strand:- start:2078 stop:3298 length:1221 start_codon:yes stop_codon:yes gene_type:complete
LVWGPNPLINNSLWSNAAKECGFDSKTVMKTYFNSIHKKHNFDIYTNELKILRNKFFNKFCLIYYPEYSTFLFCLSRFDIFHFHFDGGFLAGTKYQDKEAEILKRTGCKTIVTPYGADYFQYSLINDPVLQHGLLMSYPMNSTKESEINDRVKYWTKNADCLPITVAEGVGRWDMVILSLLGLNLSSWKFKKEYNTNNGLDGPVSILHAPNHRGFKGTEYIIQAVNDLKKEGLQIKLILLENVQNEEVQRIMYDEADIHAEQLIYSDGYGLNGIEGMATGLPVLSCLDNEKFMRLFRLFSFLDECPILSTNIENIKSNLRILIKNPKLRINLGKASRNYVEKYHSYKTSNFIFGKIYEKVWYEKDVDLMNLFNPLNPESYNNQSPIINHPLVKNKIPKELMKKLNK